jgi:hypothetical protein
MNLCDLPLAFCPPAERRQLDTPVNLATIG